MYKTTARRTSHLSRQAQQEGVSSFLRSAARRVEQPAITETQVRASWLAAWDQGKIRYDEIPVQFQV